MRNNLVTSYQSGIVVCCLLYLSLCSHTWAAGSPALQIARDHQSSSPFPRIAIIIDDLGYNHEYGEWASRLPGAVTLSVLPFGPYSQQIAEFGAAQNKEIMLHAPMSSILDKPLDEGGLTPDMNKLEFVATLKQGLASLPQIKGVNNHMGSELTQQHQPMTWLMQELRERELYFVDSRTIASSLAWETALSFGVPTTQRDVFLDNDTQYAAIAIQFGKLLSLAKRRGQAVAIAHPYPETLTFLQAALPMLQQAGIELVPVSALLPPPRAMTKRAVDRPGEVVGLMTFLSE